MRTRVLIGVLECFTTNKDIQDGGKMAFQCHKCGSSGGIYLSQIELNTVEIMK